MRGKNCAECQQVWQAQGDVWDFMGICGPCLKSRQNSFPRSQSVTGEEGR